MVLKYKFLSPGLGKLLSQAKLPTATFLSVFLLSKRYNAKQAISVGLILCGIILFCCIKVGAEPIDGFGAFCALFDVLGAATSAVLMEKVMREDKKVYLVLIYLLIVFSFPL